MDRFIGLISLLDSCGHPIVNHIKIRVFSGDPWNRMTQLHPSAWSLSGVVERPSITGTRHLSTFGSMSGKNVVVNISMPFHHRRKN
ncbi:MAG: hypothetical protein H0X47_09935 [Nitrospirales bacterium]|nr:hypothetical protein [Nitrospirales bacterium]